MKEFSSIWDETKFMWMATVDIGAANVKNTGLSAFWLRAGGLKPRFWKKFEAPLLLESFLR